MKKDKKYIYAPGCALMSYKPHLAERLKSYIEEEYGEIDTLLTCCFNNPLMDKDTCVITPCATCAENYAKHYQSIFFLEELAQSATFPFPDYHGVKMSIQDTCSARHHPQYLETIRLLIERMNIQLIEPKCSGKNAKCCGQTFYGKVEEAKVATLMKSRADEMPCDDVVVYCASCIMSMSVGGKKPRYILDLLFEEPTMLLTQGIKAWNNTLLQFRNSH